MGGSSSINDSRQTESFYVTPSVLADEPRLIPGLVDEVSLQILARTPRIGYLSLQAVSRSWKAAVTCPEIYHIRKELGITEEWLYILMNKGLHGCLLHALDPVSKRWQTLPRIPNRGLLSFGIMYGSCAIAAVDDCLYLLGGESGGSSLTRVLKYDPVSNRWSDASPMSVGRAYFETGVINKKLFVVGGISFGHVGDNNNNNINYRVSKTHLQSAEVFDPQTGLWSEIRSMPCSKAHPTAFLLGSRDQVKLGLAPYRGKLYVPQLFSHLSVLAVGGEVYDPETNSWVDMPTGMAQGWPACLGTKLSVIVDGDLYAPRRVTSTSVGVKVYVYDHCNDSWKLVEGYVPLRVNSRYMLTGLRRKLHVITVDDNNNIVVMRADKRDEGDSESYIWNAIAFGNFGFGHHEGCQNLDI